MADRVARLVTADFAPAVLLTVLLEVVGWHAFGNSLAGVAWGLTAALLASIIPFVVILRGARRDAFTDHLAGRREQRRTPLVIGLGSVMVGLLVLVMLGAERELLAALAAVVSLAVVLLAVSHWWKISLRSAGAAGFVLILTGARAVARRFRVGDDGQTKPAMHGESGFGLAEPIDARETIERSGRR